MQILTLEKPTEEHEDRANSFKKEFLDHGERTINGSGLLDQLEFKDWLQHTIQNSKSETAQSNWVPTSTFFAVDRNDGEIIGMIDVRHHIEHPFLSEYGGHIGFAVRPTKRRRGYAREMLGYALDYARELGLKDVMLGCYADNLGSIKTITGCGGKLLDEKLYEDGKPMHIYWISLY